MDRLLTVCGTTALSFVENREGFGWLQPVIGAVFGVACLDDMKSVSVT